MNIDEMREYAEKNGFDSVEFSFVNLKGETVNCKWLDAYFGMFKLGNSKGFVTVESWKKMANDVFDLIPTK